MNYRAKIRQILPAPLMKLISSFRSLKYRRAVLKQWNNNGRPIPPPPFYKQNVVFEYGKKHHASLLIETGTYRGEMVMAQRSLFKKIISIELDIALYNSAKEYFKGDSSIVLYQGDSGVVLKSIMPEVRESAIFWLDGHFSGEITAKGMKNCPVLEELEAIFVSNLDHVILIDDARLFNGENDYPTIEVVRELITRKNPRYVVEVKDDIIRATIE